MDIFFSSLDFFASGLGLLITSVMATLIILVWDWRFSLACLFIVQLGVSTVLVLIHGIEPQWVMVQTLVVALCCLILALSASEAQANHTLQGTSPWSLRFMAMLLVIVGWNLTGVQVTLPEINPQVLQLFTWIGICALIVLGLSDTPLFTGIALLLWLIPIQAIVEVLLPIPTIAIFLGLINLLIALSCSYLVLVRRVPTQQNSSIPTDITFPNITGEHQAVSDPITSNSIPALPSPAYTLTKDSTQEHHHVQFPARNPQRTDMDLPVTTRNPHRTGMDLPTAARNPHRTNMDLPIPPRGGRRTNLDLPAQTPPESDIEAFDPEPTFNEQSTGSHRPVPPPDSPAHKTGTHKTGTHKTGIYKTIKHKTRKPL